MAYEIEVNLARPNEPPVWVAMVDRGRAVRCPTKESADAVVQEDGRDPGNVRIVERP